MPNKTFMSFPLICCELFKKKGDRQKGKKEKNKKETETTPTTKKEDKNLNYRIKFLLRVGVNMHLFNDWF